MSDKRKYPKEQFRRAWQEVNAIPLSPYMMGYSIDDWNRLTDQQREDEIKSWRTRQVFQLLGSQIR